MVKFIRATRRDFSLIFGSSGNYEITVFDMRGRIVAQKRSIIKGGFERIFTQDDQFHPGVYAVYISFAQQDATIRSMIVQ